MGIIARHRARMAFKKWRAQVKAANRPIAPLPTTPTSPTTPLQPSPPAPNPAVSRSDATARLAQAAAQPDTGLTAPAGVSGATTPARAQAPTSVTIERQPGSSLLNPSRRDREEAEMYLRRTQASEDTYLTTKKSRPEDRERYLRLVEALGPDAYTRAELRKLLLSGKLTAKSLRADGDSLLVELDKMATRPLAAGIDRRELLASTIREIADPARISQQGKGTCVATVAIIMVARKFPAEYARLVAELATTGTVRVGSATLQREPDFNADDRPASNGGVTSTIGRSTPQRLLQSAFMEYANGRLDYNNTTDSSNGRAGLFLPESESLLENLVGGRWRNLNLEGNRSAQELDGAMAQLGRASEAHKAVPVNLYYVTDPPGSQHQVLVTKIENGRAYFSNPWGREESMPLADFRSKLAGMVLPSVPHTPRRPWRRR